MPLTNLRSIDGKTAFDYAEDQNNSQLYTILINHDSIYQNQKSNLLIEKDGMLTFNFKIMDAYSMFKKYAYDRCQMVNENFRCNFHLSTSEYGALGYVQEFLGDKYVLPYDKIGINCYDLILSSVIANIDLGLSIDKICEKLKSQTPSENWQVSQYISYSLLSDEEQKLIDNYKSYSYRQINLDLRDVYDKDTKINNIVRKTTPLTNDIVVYRYIRNILPQPDKDPIEYIHTGHLSTSFSPSFMTETLCKSNSHLLRIKVPAGKHGFFIPSSEVEIIFQHPTKLLITSSEKILLLCKDKKDIISTRVYDAIML